MMVGGYKYEVSQFLRDSVFRFCYKIAVYTISLNSDIESFHPKISTTRSQKRRNSQQKSTESVSEGLVSRIVPESLCQMNQDASIAGPSHEKSPRVENSFLKRLRVSLKEEITSEIRNLLVEFQKEMLRLLKPKTGEM